MVCPDFQRKHRLAWLSAVCALLLFSGCARYQLLEAEIYGTHADVKRVEAQLLELAKTVDGLGVNQGGATSKMKADLVMLIKDLESQLEKVQSEMDESQYRSNQLEKKIDLLRNQRIILGTARDSGGSRDSGDTLRDSTRSGARLVDGLDLEKIYNQAREDFYAGKYDLARKGLQTLLEKDQTGLYKDNALYWMGECHFKQNQPDLALQHYDRCVNEYPHGNKMCSALFKGGLVYEKKGDLARRNEYWKSLIERCPGSNEAKRAQDLMK